MRLLVQRGAVTVKQLAAELDVVPITVRRDLEVLEQKGMLTRIHGGAVANPEPMVLRPLDVKETMNHEAKVKIGGRAASMIENGETVILDEGSTCIEIARALRNHRDVTVVTNGVKVAYELCSYPNITTILIGGVCGHSNYVAYGHETISSFAKIRAHKYFMGIDAIQTGFGISDGDPHQVQLKQAKAASAAHIVGVADNSKTGKIGVVRVGGLDMLDTLIMNAPIHDGFRTALEQDGVELIEV